MAKEVIWSNRAKFDRIEILDFWKTNQFQELKYNEWHPNTFGMF